jgi:hypothetical protein
MPSGVLKKVLTRSAPCLDSCALRSGFIKRYLVLCEKRSAPLCEKRSAPLCEEYFFAF